MLPLRIHTARDDATGWGREAIGSLISLTVIASGISVQR